MKFNDKVRKFFHDLKTNCKEIVADVGNSLMIPVRHGAEMISLVKGEIIHSSDRKWYEECMQDVDIPEPLLPSGLNGFFADASLPDGVSRFEPIKAKAFFSDMFSNWTPGWQNRVDR